VTNHQNFSNQNVSRVFVASPLAVACVGEAIGQSNVLRTGQTLKGKRG
jgi:hypothetical protein